MIDICPMHADETVIGVIVSEEVGFSFECTRRGHPSGCSYRWTRVPERPGFEGLGQRAEELGLAVELPAALKKYEGQWIEYGVVEREYALANADDWAALVDEYGHTAVAAKRYTASAFLGATLGRLARHGAIAYHTGPATGRWSYNSDISWWSLDPATPWQSRLSWVDSGATVEYVPARPKPDRRLPISRW